MNWIKRSLSLGALWMLLLAFPLQVLAAGGIEPIKLTKSTALTLEYQYDNTALSNVTFSLYRVGNVNKAGTFSMTGDFESFNDSDDAWDVMAEKMAKVAKEKNVTPKRRSKTNGDGLLAFQTAENDKLSTGLYLVVGETTYEQDILGEQARHRYDRYATTPFLVSLPTYVNAAWNYECAAAPKSSLQYCYRVIFTIIRKPLRIRL